MATGQTAGMQHFPQPDGLPPANGYSHAVAFTGRLVVISGQVPAGPDGQVVGAGNPAAQSPGRLGRRPAMKPLTAGPELRGEEWREALAGNFNGLVPDLETAGGLPHFSRAFRARYGMTPSQARHAGPAAGEPRRSAAGQPGRVDD